MQQKYYNKKYYFRKFYKENLVLLNAKNLWTLRFSKKLLYKYIKPFHIKKSVKMQTYYLSLLISYWIYSIFYISLLELYKNRNEEREAHIFKNITIDKYNKYKIKKKFNRKNVKSKI